MVNNMEWLWLQVQLPHIKPILVGCCYRAPSAKIEYLSELCDMLDKLTEENRELYCLGDLNVDWLTRERDVHPFSFFCFHPYERPR